MGVGGGWAELPREVSSPMSPGFSPLIQEEHVFLSGLSSSLDGPGF